VKYICLFVVNDLHIQKKFVVKRTEISETFHSMESTFDTWTLFFQRRKCRAIKISFFLILRNQKFRIFYDLLDSQ
jgi:hypothetical protein